MLYEKCKNQVCGSFGCTCKSSTKFTNIKPPRTMIIPEPWVKRPKKYKYVCRWSSSNHVFRKQITVLDVYSWSYRLRCVFSSNNTTNVHMLCEVYQLNILFKQEEEHFWPNHDNDGVVPEPPGGTGGEQDHTARGRKEKDGNTSSPNAASVNLLYNIILKRW